MSIHAVFAINKEMNGKKNCSVFFFVHLLTDFRFRNMLYMACEREKKVVFS